MEIKNKIIEYRLVNWRTLNWLQNDTLKDIDREALEKLKNSLKKNNFIQPFNLWKDNRGKYWVLDGSHRQKAMIELESEGISIPKNLPANILKCKDKKEAAKYVLLYSSSYAKISEFGLKDYLDINKLLIKNLSDEIDLANINLESLFTNDDLTNNDIEIEMEKKSLSDVYVVVGEYRILMNRKKYLKWLEDLKVVVGFDNEAVIKEIKKRLKLS